MGSNSFQNEFSCSLCVKYFIDPVTLGCGHSFCMPCLCLCQEKAHPPPCCPVCNQMNLKTNIVLKTQVFLARRTEPNYLPSSEEQMCEIHMKTKNFFCEVTKDVLCPHCCKSEEHVAHRHWFIDWMAEEHWQNLLKQMRCVWEKIQETKRNLKRETNKIRTWEGFVTLWRKMICAEYWKVCHLVNHEEKRYLEKIEEESKEIFQQLKESQHSMDLKQKLLRQIYEEPKELCRKSDMELLQHYDNMSKRSESVQLHTPQPVVPQLSSWPIPGLLDWLGQFQADIALDNEAVTCHVHVLEDLRRLLTGPDPPGVDNPPPNIFLPGELNRSLPGGITGRWMWRAVATG